MHVVIATDGSKQSLKAARYLRSFADPASVTSVGVVAVISPLAAVPFATEGDTGRTDIEELSFRAAAEVLADWGPKISKSVRSGSPAAEIVKAAKAKDADLIVIASTSSRTAEMLMGSVAHRVLNHAPCPVLVVRPGMKAKKRATKA
jgi:nucleotide-binding universal stress UspA family protein